MKKDEFLNLINDIDDKFLNELANDQLQRKQVNEEILSEEAEEALKPKYYRSDSSKSGSPFKNVIIAIAAVACVVTAGVFVGVNSKWQMLPSDSSIEVNYFGGEGELNAENFLIYDENNVYINLGDTTVKKYNKNANTLTIACETPGCVHSPENVECKARMKYCVFNGNLVRMHNKSITNSDGTVAMQGYLYLCDKSEKPVYKNELPEGIDKEKYDNEIGTAFALGDDYLVLFNGVYIYILDTDFNVKYTIFDIGSYGGGVYYANNEIYYIDNLYRLQKLDMVSGNPSLVDLGGMKITEGFVVGDLLWFSNEAMTLCSYDFKTGEIKEYAKNAVRLTGVGKYIEYLEYNRGGVYLFNTETGTAIKREDIDINSDYLFFLNGEYYKYNNINGELIFYEDDLTTVIKTCTLSD